MGLEGAAAEELPVALGGWGCQTPLFPRRLRFFLVASVPPAAPRDICGAAPRVTHPVNTPLLGDTSPHFQNFIGFPGAQELRKGTKESSS